MEEHVRKGVSPRASGTTVLVQQSLLVDTVKRERATSPTELLETLLQTLHGLGPSPLTGGLPVAMIPTELCTQIT